MGLPHRLGRDEGRGRADGGGDTGRRDKILFRALAGAPGGTHCLEPKRTVPQGGRRRSRPGWLPGRPSSPFGGLEDGRPRGPSHLRCHVGRFLVLREPRSSGSKKQGGTYDLLGHRAGSPGQVRHRVGAPRLAKGSRWRRRTWAAHSALSRVVCVLRSRPSGQSGRRTLTPPRRAASLLPSHWAGLFWLRNRQQRPGAVPTPNGGLTNPRLSRQVGVASSLQSWLWAEPSPERIWAERPQ